jgi:hypothetical protein
MKKKSVLVLGLFALSAVGLAACGQGTSSSSSAASSPVSSSSSQQTIAISISNKDALKAEWHVGEADREVSIGLTPAGNITALINAGTITVTSSDPTVVSVNGKYLSPVKAGTATITVAYVGSGSDTVDLTIGEKLTAPDYQVKSLADLMAITDDTAGTYAYVTSGTVNSFKTGTDGGDYGNLYFTNGADKATIYGATASVSALSYDFAKKAFTFTNPKDFMTNSDTKGIKVGDVLDVVAIRCDYKTTKEISIVIRAINGKAISNGVKTTDEIQDMVADSFYNYTVKGVIKSWKNASATDGSAYGNLHILTDGSKKDPLYIYGATGANTASTIDATAGTWKFTNPKDFLTNDDTKDLAIGDVVEVLGFRCDYQGAIEMNGIIHEVNPLSVALPEDTANTIKTGTGTVTLSIVSTIDGDTWTCASSDTDVATVTNTGVVTAGTKAGTATITVTDAKGKTATIEIYVSDMTATDTTIDAIVAGTDMSTTTLYKVSGILEGNKGDDYGNGYLTDPTSGKSVMIYGNTTTATSISWSNGAPKFTNPKDAKTTLKDYKDGEKVTMNVVYKKFGTTPEILGYSISHETVTTTYTASLDAVENGTAVLDKTDNLAYGDTVTVTVTPDAGYVIDSVKVTTAFGSVDATVDAADSTKYTFEATCVNTVVVKMVANANIYNHDFTALTGDEVIYSNSTAAAPLDIVSEGLPTISFVGVKTQSSATSAAPYGYVFMAGSASAFGYNKTAYASHILFVSINIKCGSGTQAPCQVSFGTEALNTAVTPVATDANYKKIGSADTPADENEFVFTPSTDTATFWNFSVTSKNFQVKSIKVYCAK